MTSESKKNRERITLLLLIISFTLIITAFIIESPMAVLEGEWKIITSPGILITDYIALANLGSTLFNAGLTTLMGLGLAWLINAHFDGSFLSAIFLVTGFSFFGKNPLNMLPIFLGGYLYDAYLASERSKNIIGTLLFATTLGPVVSQVIFGFDLGPLGFILGILAGIVCGGMTAGLVKHVRNLHLGFNLYNTGTTAGIVGTFIYILMRGLGVKIEPLFYWSTEYTPFLTYYISALLIFLVIMGIFWGADTESYKKILRSKGKPAPDYIQTVGLGTALVNMGVVGLIGLLYVTLVGGDVNGPIIAGVLSIAGFGSFGKHPRTIIPIMLGVYLCCIPCVWGHSDPGPLLAALFGTALAPFSGQLGFVGGVGAGALHSLMVMHVGGVHGYMNLYNNGFSAGLVMLILVGLIKGINPKILEENYERKPIFQYIKINKDQ